MGPLGAQCTASQGSPGSLSWTLSTKALEVTLLTKGASTALMLTALALETELSTWTLLMEDPSGVEATCSMGR